MAGGKERRHCVLWAAMLGATRKCSAPRNLLSARAGPAPEPRTRPLLKTLFGRDWANSGPGLRYHAHPAGPRRGVIWFLGRDVAQPGSALAWGARGPEFKSRRPDQYLGSKAGSRSATVRQIRPSGTPAPPLATPSPPVRRASPLAAHDWRARTRESAVHRSDR